MISLIVAVAKNNVIGKDNKLIWHISEDLKRFKQLTTGKTMIMGRKTFESLPGVLPNREHIVVTRDKNFTIDSDKVEVAYDLNSLIKEYINSDEEIFVIGGADIYKQMLPYASKLYLTKIDKDFDGDTFFPEINYDEFKPEDTSEKFTNEKDGLVYQFINLIRR